MKKPLRSAAIALLLGVLPWTALAQMEKLTEKQIEAGLTELKKIQREAADPDLRELLENTLKEYELTRYVSSATPEQRDASERRLVSVVRLATDVQARKRTGKFVHYAVPPMSEMQRLPDIYPIDGKAFAPVRIIAAQDEFEPGSFVVCPLKDLGKVRFTVGEIKSSDGKKVFPVERIDLKVVKVWYQNYNGWYSYFADTGLKLTPELLLNDEDLIRVDQREIQNYARVTGADGTRRYHWISPPLMFDRRFDEFFRSLSTFFPMAPGFEDAKTLQPVTLNAGKFKQFFLTVRSAADQEPGLYSGAVYLAKDGIRIGEIPVTIRVLPFKLPRPAAYFDVEKPFLTASYNYLSWEFLKYENGGDLELAKKQFQAVLENQRDHNQTIHMMRGRFFDGELDWTIDLLKRTGMSTNPLMGGGIGYYSRDPSRRLPDLRHDAKEIRRYLIDKVGHTNLYLGFGDEPGAKWVREHRYLFDIYQEQGIKFFIAGGMQVFHTAGYLYDFFNVASIPEDREQTRPWNEVGRAHVAWYARQHVGPENPAFNRRQYGFAPYFANYSAVCNYAHHLGPYNDRSEGYKPMVFAYGTHSGVIDTLQWEGFREGIDDIRYATALKRLALEAAASPALELRRAGGIALQYLAEIQPDTADPDTVRLEIIEKIMDLRRLLRP